MWQVNLAAAQYLLKVPVFACKSLITMGAGGTNKQEQIQQTAISLPHSMIAFYLRLVHVTLTMKLTGNYL